MEHLENDESERSHRPSGPQGRPPARSGESREDFASADADAEHKNSAEHKDSPPLLPAFTPVPRLRDRSNGWKPHIQQRFIEALAETGSVAAACKRLGRADVGAYLLRRHPEAASFRAAWDAALDLGVRRIEDEAMDRALYGVEEVVVQNGETVVKRRRYNEQLVMFMLRNRAPERFADGGARGLNAVDKMRLKRLKAAWREEWEEEWREKTRPRSLDEVRDSILAKLEGIDRAERERWTEREAELHAELETERYARQVREAREDRDRFRAMNPGKWHNWLDPEEDYEADGGQRLLESYSDGTLVSRGAAAGEKDDWPRSE